MDSMIHHIILLKFIMSEMKSGQVPFTESRILNNMLSALRHWNDSIVLQAVKLGAGLM